MSIPIDPSLAAANVQTAYTAWQAAQTTANTAWQALNATRLVLRASLANASIQEGSAADTTPLAVRSLPWSQGVAPVVAAQ